MRIILSLRLIPFLILGSAIPALQAADDASDLNEIVAGRPSSESGQQELNAIEKQANDIRETIDATKPPRTSLKAYNKTEEVLIPLAESESVIIRSDNVTMRGWEGPGIKIVLEKTILAKEKPDPKKFNEIRVVHEITVAEELVGKTQDQRAADEQKFRESPQGKKMTNEQLDTRQAFVRNLFSGFDQFRDFQGVTANVLSIAGLRHDEGNEQVTLHTKSPSGASSFSSAWMRQAAVTVYVPRCKQVLVAGCMVKLDIADVHANLMLSTRDSRDRGCGGTFVVRSLDGDVVIDQAPVRVLDGVSGNVFCTVTDEFVNSGTQHSGQFRTANIYDTAKTDISNVKGNIKARFLRTNLHLSELHGAIDVHNEYGATSLTLTAPVTIDRAMRIISESGQITLKAKSDLLESIPIYAYTQCGALHTDLSQSILEYNNFSTGTPRRSWQGFITPTQERFSPEKFERPVKAINDDDRTAGLDLISHCGRVEVLKSDH